MEYNCKCVPVLLDNGYLTTAALLNIETGETTPQIVLGKLKECKSGKLSVIPEWYLVRFCPNCGKPIRKEESKSNDD